MAKKAPTIPFCDLEVGQLDGLLARIQPLIQPQDFQLLERIVTTIRLILGWIQSKDLSFRRLRRMIFGPKTEKSSDLLPKDKAADPKAPPASTNPSAPPKEKTKGHGRNGVEDYPGAQRILVPHEKYHPGCSCPLCLKGRLYDMNQPAVAIRIIAQPPFPGKIYEMMRLRCSRCLAIFVAQTPAEAGEGQ